MAPRVSYLGVRRRVVDPVDAPIGTTFSFSSSPKDLDFSHGATAASDAAIPLAFASNEFSKLKIDEHQRHGSVLFIPSRDGSFKLKRIDHSLSIDSKLSHPYQRINHSGNLMPASDLHHSKWNDGSRMRSIGLYNRAYAADGLDSQSCPSSPSPFYCKHSKDDPIRGVTFNRVFHTSFSSRRKDIPCQAL